MTKKIIGSGDTSSISDGQIDSDDIVLGGGILEIEFGGSALDTTILGNEMVLDGGSDSGAVIQSGGVQTIQFGGNATNATVASGGTEIIQSGGAARDLVISGGTVEVQDGGSLSGSVTFTGDGTLQIDGTTMPDATIYGFTDPGRVIDLANVSFTSGGTAQLTAGNVLEVSEGGQTVKLQLDPNQDFGGHSFNLASDGHGGTTVVDPSAPFVFTVSNEAQLNNVIYQADTTGGNYIVKVTGTIDLTSHLTVLGLLANTQYFIIEGTTSGGNNAQVQTIDGLGSQRGFFVLSGNVTLQDLNINNTLARGGDGGAGGGGGGAGLGGGLFVANTHGLSAGNVTLVNVGFSNDGARGGNGAAGDFAGGGGGLGGNGGNGSGGGGGGGGIGRGPNANGGAGGGNAGTDGAHGGDGIAVGDFGSDYYAAGQGGSGQTGGGGGGGYYGGGGGGGGGGPGNWNAGGGGGGGGIGGGNAGSGGGSVGGSGGVGGFGGGGGGASGPMAGNSGARGGPGGFGGGGGAGGHATHGGGGYGGKGGFGGGGGAGISAGGAGGWGGGAGVYARSSSQANSNPGGGGGLGAGGDIFVQQGAILTIEGDALGAGSVGQGTVTGGQGGSQYAGAGAAVGSSIFLQGNQTITFSPASGQTQTVSGAIADQGGGANGSGSVAINGGGTVVFAAPSTEFNTYHGGTTVSGQGTTLAIYNGLNLGNGGLTLGGGTTLDVLASTTLQAANPIALSGEATIETTPGNTVTVNSRLSGGTLDIRGGGTVDLTNANNNFDVPSIGDHSTLIIHVSGAQGQNSGGVAGTIQFNGAGTLKFAGTTTPWQTISGIGQDDVIDLAGVAYQSNATGSINGNTLTITSGGQTYQLLVSLANNTGNVVHLLNDGSGGTDVVINNNLLVDSDFGLVELVDGTPGVVVDPTKGNYTHTAPLSWQGNSNVGAFAPTAAATPAFAGAQVAYLNDGGVLSQTFTTGTNAEGGYQFLVNLNVGNRIDTAPATGSATITLSVGGVAIGQTVFNAAAAPTGTSIPLSFITGNLDPLGLANQNVTLTINNTDGSQLTVGSATVQAVPSSNLLTDGNFSADNLANGAPGVTTEPIYGNYTSVAPTGWQGNSNVGAQAATAAASTSFAGQQVAYLNAGGVLSQTVTSPSLTSGADPRVVSLDIATRLDHARPTGKVTITATVGSTVVGQTTFNATGAPAGVATHLQFATQDLNALGLAGQPVTLTISNGTDGQVNVDNVAVQAPLTFDVGSGALLSSAIGAINGGSSHGYQIDATAGFSLGGSQILTPSAGAVVILDGAAIGGSGSLTFGSASGMLVVAANETYSGGTTIGSGSTLEIETGSVAGSGAISFSGIGNTLKIDATTVPSNTIQGMAQGNTIDLAGVAYDAAGSANLVGNQLQITENGHAYDLTLSGIPAGSYFHLGADAGGGTSITESSVACYCRGTRIATGSRDKPVEELVIGDAILTASGELRPIKWIGRRSYGGRFIIGRKDILPICIKAGALDVNLPSRDLWISPHHAMYFDDRGGLLVEARDLVNGVSIVQVEEIEMVEYFHIELETHDVIIAEDALSETFLDDDNRGMFHNAHEYRALYPEQDAGARRYYAPRLDEGYELEAIRRRIARRAGLISDAPDADPGELRGYVDLVSPRMIEGWAQNVRYPEAPVCLDIFAEGALIGQALASVYRDDLERAGLGSGRHAFAFVPPPGVRLSPGTIEVRRALDGVALEGLVGTSAGRQRKVAPRAKARSRASLQIQANV